VYRRLFIMTLLGLAITPLAQAGGEAIPPPIAVKPIPGGVVIDGRLPGDAGDPGGGGDGGGRSGGCPDFRMGPIEAYVGNGLDGSPLYAITSYRCGADSVAVRVFVCISNCPAGVSTFVPPPTVEAVHDDIEALASLPDPVWAPPLHDGAFALVGKYLYFSVTPASHQVVDRELVFPGGWWARAVLTPGDVTMWLTGHEPQTCAGPGPDPRTEEGRAGSSCRMLVDVGPESGRGEVSVAISWDVVVTSNVDGVPGSWLIQTRTTRAIDIKQLQAVILP
jgi:hypothetical protein